MKSRPADQQLLLEIASLDTVIRAADHARRNPEHAGRVQELLAQRQAMSAELTRLLGARDDVQAELARVESDVALVDARVARDTTLLSASANAKEAQGLEHELASLAKRKNDLAQVGIAMHNYHETNKTLPPDKQAFVDFLQKSDPSTASIVNGGQYTFYYAKVPPPALTEGTHTVVVRGANQTGSDGRRLVLFADNHVDLLNDAEFNAKPKLKDKK